MAESSLISIKFAEYALYAGNANTRYIFQLHGQFSPETVLANSTLLADRAKFVPHLFARARMKIMHHRVAHKERLIFVIQLVRSGLPVRRGWALPAV